MAYEDQIIIMNIIITSIIIIINRYIAIPENLYLL